MKPESPHPATATLCLPSPFTGRGLMTVRRMIFFIVELTRKAEGRGQKAEGKKMLVGFKPRPLWAINIFWGKVQAPLPLVGGYL
jgi:hypothetical protein